MWVHLTIVRKGLILVFVPFAFQLLFVWLVANLERENSNSQEWANHTREVLTQAQTVLANLLDVQTGMRGYAISGDPAFAERNENAARAARHSLQELETLVGDNPNQEAQARRIAAGAVQLLDWNAENERLIRTGRQAEAMAKIKTGEGRRRMDQLRDQIAVFVAEEDRLNAIRDEDLNRARTRFRWLQGIGAAASVSIALVLGLVFQRGIGGRLAAIMGNTRLLARGEELPPLLAGSDEISQLDAALHRMAQELALSSRALQRLNDELEATVQRRTSQLAEANRDLTQKNRENETFVYSASHDLRSPLINLQGFSKELGIGCRELHALLTESDLPEAVRKRGLALLDTDMGQCIQFIQSAVVRLSNIIDALLLLSRAGRLDPQWQPVDLNAVLARIADSLQGTIAERGAQVQVHELPPICGDPTSIERIFANLLTNALTYLDPKRPGQIEVGMVDSSSPKPTGTKTKMRTFYVRDNGVGIPAISASKVFQAFKRFRPDLAEGEGMGLAISHRLVDRHGGRIWFESVAGEGSTFFVALPVHPPDASELSTTQVQASDSLSKASRIIESLTRS